MNRVGIFFSGAWTFALAVAMGCSPVKERPSIERMPAVSCETMSPRICAEPCGTPRVWDFTKGLPAAGKLRKGGRLSPEGLAAADATNMSHAAGFQLDKLWTPPGAFLFEAAFVPGKLGASGTLPHTGHLWDDMAVNYVPKRTNRGFQILVAARDGMWTPTLWAGFSNDTARVVGPSVRLTPGTPAQIALYFGADGRVAWDFNGELKETPLAISGPLAPSVRHQPVIGDRVCSLYHPFDGVIRRVSITPCRTSSLTLRPEGRLAFRRGETNATVRATLTNLGAEPLTAVRVVAEQFVEEGRARRTELALDPLAAGASAPVVCGVETRLRPGWHALRLTVCGKSADGEEMRLERTFRIGIGPRSADRMMALMWGFGAPVATLADYGFTHGLTAAPPGDVTTGATYDEALVAGIGLTHSMRLTFPEYVREAREDTMARALHEKIDGSGYEARQVVSRTAIDFRHYDTLFQRFTYDEPATAVDCAFRRLLYPYQLEPAAEERYRTYIKAKSAEILPMMIRGDREDLFDDKGNIRYIPISTAETEHRIRFMASEKLIEDTAKEPTNQALAEAPNPVISAILLNHWQENGNNTETFDLDAL